MWKLSGMIRLSKKGDVFQSAISLIAGWYLKRRMGPVVPPAAVDKIRVQAPILSPFYKLWEITKVYPFEKRTRCLNTCRNGLDF